MSGEAYRDPNQYGSENNSARILITSTRGNPKYLSSPRVRPPISSPAEQSTGDGKDSDSTGQRSKVRPRQLQRGTFTSF
ncbi:hypothetical protein ACOSQ3_006173 [Xanthoceras sorbifolium]